MRINYLIIYDIKKTNDPCFIISAVAAARNAGFDANHTLIFLCSELDAQACYYDHIPPALAKNSLIITFINDMMV